MTKGNKSKKDVVVSEMRARLLANRNGKMTPGQWLDMVLYPVMTLMVVMIPLSVVLLPVLFRIALRLWTVGPILLLVFAYVFISRAYRYARAPIHFATLTPRRTTLPVRLFWKSITLYDEDGSGLKFGKWLAPRPSLKGDQAYIVYYLKDQDSHIVLSLAPANHPDVKLWQPTNLFEQRMARRRKQSK